MLYIRWVWTNLQWPVFTVIASYWIFSLPWKSSVLYVFIPLLSRTTHWWLITDFCTVSVLLSFTECHVIGIKQNVVFSDCLYSLSNVHLKFFHVFPWIDSSFVFCVILCFSFIFLVLKSIIVWIYQFIYPFTYGKASWTAYKFWKLWVKMLSTGFCVDKFSIPLSISQGERLLGCAVRIFLIFWQTTKLSFSVALPFYMLTSNKGKFLLLHILVSVWCCLCSGFQPFY